VVCGIIITYNPSEDILHNASLVCPQIDHLIVVDNGSQATHLPKLIELQERFECTLIHNRSNLGIAAGLNIGFRAALELGAEWIVSFDQDSAVSDQFLDNMLATFTQESQVRPVGMVAPRCSDRLSNKPIPLARDRSGQILTAMTSGCLMRAETFKRIGHFEEKFYMDYVDIEYCLRLRRLGLRIVESEKAVLLHSLGRATWHSVLGRQLVTTNHSARRRYYITRNRLSVYRKYPRETAWIYYDGRSMLQETLMICLFEADRFNKLRYIAKGLLDFALARMGERVTL